MLKEDAIRKIVDGAIKLAITEDYRTSHPLPICESILHMGNVYSEENMRLCKQRFLKVKHTTPW